MIHYEKEIIDYLKLPGIPKRKWDGKSSFKRGVAITKLISGINAYALSSFDNQKDKEPKIIKVFALEPYNSIDLDSIKVVPDYMQTDGVDDWDLDEESKKEAKSIIQEAEEMITIDNGTEIPDYEYSFDFIKSDEEALAYIRSWNEKHGKRKSKLPKTHESIIAKLAVIYSDEQTKRKKLKRG